MSGVGLSRAGPTRSRAPLANSSILHFSIFFSRKFFIFQHVRKLFLPNRDVSWCPIVNNRQGLYEDERPQEYLDGGRPGAKVVGGQKSKKRGQIYQKNWKNAKNGGMEYWKSMFPHGINRKTNEYQLLMHRLSSRKHYILGFPMFSGRQTVEKRAFSMKKSPKSRKFKKI